MRIIRACLTCVPRTGGLRDCRTIERVTSEPDLVRWLATASPGDVAEYDRGFVSIDRLTGMSKLPPAERDRLDALAGRAFAAAEQGLLHLVQARVETGGFRYLAVAAKRPHRTSQR